MFFIDHRNKAFMFSGLLLLIFLVSFAVRGLNLGVDFAGGTVIQVAPGEEFTLDQVREVVREFELEDASFRRVEGREDSGEEVSSGGVIIKTAVLSEEERDGIMEALHRRWPRLEEQRMESVGGVIGEEQLRRSLIALAVALAAMVAYITLRFQFTYALSTIVALIHDVLMVLGVFSLFQLELNLPFVAALLTIVGYSINDTIVIIDRIRENLKGRRKKEYPAVVNESIFQNLTRSLNTSFTTMLVLIALLVGFYYYIGVMGLIVFLVALIIGIISGTYSSIFIASPFWLMIKERQFQRGR